MIFRHEKENKTFIIEIEDLKSEVDNLARSKTQAVSMTRELESKLIEMTNKVDDAVRQLTEANHAKTRLVEENLTFSRRIETLEFELSSIQSLYKRVVGDYEEARIQLESEMAVRFCLVEPEEKNLFS